MHMSGLAKARHDRLVVEAVSDELVVYDLDRGTVHLLNPVAALVWKHCDGRTTVAQLASLLHAEECTKAKRRSKDAHKLIAERFWERYPNARLPEKPSAPARIATKWSAWRKRSAAP